MFNKTIIIGIVAVVFVASIGGAYLLGYKNGQTERTAHYEKTINEANAMALSEQEKLITESARIKNEYTKTKKELAAIYEDCNVLYSLTIPPHCLPWQRNGNNPKASATN